MTLNKKTAVLFITTTLLGSLSTAHATDEEARRAILELRSQLKQSDIVRNDLAQKVQNLQKQVTQLQGKVETLSNATQSSLQQERADSDLGISQQVGDSTEQQAYDTALDLFRQGNYPAAASALANFSAAYPHSVLAPSAQFYEGSSRYASRDFKSAIKTLNTMVQSYPRDSKAGDALLVIAGSQLELNDITSSKATLERTVKTYPGSPAADTAKERLKMY